MHCYNASCCTPTTGSISELFASAVQVFAASQCLISSGNLNDINVPDYSRFDFIIVGAGTSGSVLANRLTESGHWSVLLIEAGDDPPAESEVPALDKSLFRTKNDWQYLTANDGIINQANINGSINWTKGKAIGGSSIINAMIYIKGNEHDYHSWHDAGNSEWNFRDISRCFKKAESYQNMDLSKHKDIFEQYGHNGPLTINTFNSSSRNITEKILSAGEFIGIKKVLDLNTANVLGAGISSVTAANGERQGLNKAYINIARQRKQLTIMKNTLVTKVLIRRRSKTAYGIMATRGLKKRVYYARNEIILSAGAINSPQLLMLSGVGPRHQLESKNIGVFVESPMVGYNLQDHCAIPIMICTNASNPESNFDRHFGVFTYIYNRTGYLAEGSISDILSFFSADKSAVRPDYQSHLTIIWKNTPNVRNIMMEQFRYNETVAIPIVKLNKNYTIFMFHFNLLHPNSTGNITLQSSNPKKHPLIFPKYFYENSDLESIVTGIKIFTKILNTEYFKSIGAFLARMSWPECDNYELDSRDYWKCVCMNMVGTMYHPVGTCKMGPNPLTSVVDSRLKVHNTRRLRVVDSSIMPNITSGNTNGPTTMIAERGAELIIEDNMNT